MNCLDHKSEGTDRKLAVLLGHNKWDLRNFLQIRSWFFSLRHQIHCEACLNQYGALILLTLLKSVIIV